jgi:hypothetical protein
MECSPRAHHIRVRQSKSTADEVGKKTDESVIPQVAVTMGLTRSNGRQDGILLFLAQVKKNGSSGIEPLLR